MTSAWFAYNMITQGHRDEEERRRREDSVRSRKTRIVGEGRNRVAYIEPAVPGASGGIGWQTSEDYWGPDDDVERLMDEERRLRWFLSSRIEGERTLLDVYSDLNPEWIDAIQFGTSGGPMPRVLKKDVGNRKEEE